MSHVRVPLVGIAVAALVVSLSLGSFLWQCLCLLSSSLRSDLHHHWAGGRPDSRGLIMQDLKVTTLRSIVFVSWRHCDTQVLVSWRLVSSNRDRSFTIRFWSVNTGIDDVFFGGTLIQWSTVLVYMNDSLIIIIIIKCEGHERPITLIYIILMIHSWCSNKFRSYIFWHVKSIIILTTQP